MKPIFFLLLSLFTLFVNAQSEALRKYSNNQFAQRTVMTKERCYFLSDEHGLANLYKVTLDEAKIGTIPKGKTLPILGTDSIQGLLIKVQYKNKTGWIHKSMIVDTDAQADTKVIKDEPRVSSSVNRETKKSNGYIIGMDVGFTTNKFVCMDASITKGKWYFGLSAQINTDTGTKGKSYDKTIGWDNKLDGVSDSGDYYEASYGFDLGYHFLENLCFGGGVGYAPFKQYRNFYDNTQILYKDGWYHVTKSEGGKVDAKAFINYYFKEGILGRLYIKAQYSIVTGGGFALGYQFHYL